MNVRHILGAVALLGAVAATPALAQQTELKSLPGGSLMLKDLPAANGNLQNLPGVDLNMRAQGANGGSNCTEREVSSLGLGDYRRGTLSECTVGNFSFSTVRPSSGSVATSGPIPTNPFDTGGPPPGSGGFAPRPHSMW